MHELTEKERLVLRTLTENSDRPRKQMAQDLNITEPDLSRTIKKLVDLKIIKKFTVDVDFKILGYPDGGFLILGLKDKKTLKDVVPRLRGYSEIIEIQEVFGSQHDLVIRIMAGNNERLREISAEIEEWEEVNSSVNTFTLVFGRTHVSQSGVTI